VANTRTPAASLVADLRHRHTEFAELWNRQEVGLRWSSVKRFVHPEVGSHDKLALLAVLGADTFAGS
jgi:hypothetical protein